MAARPAHWQAVWDLSAQEAAGNAAHGPAAFVDTRGSCVATEKQLVALPGSENLVVVTTADAVLVYLQRQPPAMLHHDALDLIALALIERLIRAPWPGALSDRPRSASARPP